TKAAFPRKLAKGFARLFRLSLRDRQRCPCRPAAGARWRRPVRRYPSLYTPFPSRLERRMSMSQTWLGRLRKRFSGGTKPSPRAARKPQSVRLSVEALERREVLSGNTAGYLLYPGSNLYQQTPSGLVLRDTGVRDFTAPGGTLYDLHTDGRVLLFNGSVSS